MAASYEYVPYENVCGKGVRGEACEYVNVNASGIRVCVYVSGMSVCVCCVLVLLRDEYVNGACLC